ncbi:uncharacterized protein [Antedon mediterranea]|uniref:uncharacterized protein isoform X2 n=1 Tax=Antedon mediterranea TaxID=105859 RepID=UPI003AF69D5A
MWAVDVQVFLFLLLVSVVLKAYGSSCPKVHGGALTSRSLSDSPGWTVLNIGNPITCDGYVTAWRFYPTASAEFLALVMRPHIAGSNRYVVVGRTVIPTQQVLNTEREFTLPEPDWISVKSGDVIGFKFETSLLVRDNEGTEFIVKDGISQNDLLVHTIHTINGGSYMRTYSFQAVLKDSYLPCNIIKWPFMKITTTRTTVLNVWMDDWNKIKCPGTITGWRYMAKVTTDIIGLVYRAVDADNNVYEIIGKTLLPEGEPDVVVEFPLAHSDRIDVLPGDKIGFSYTTGQLYYQFDYSNVGSIYKYTAQPSVYDIGTQVTFTHQQTRRFTFDTVFEINDLDNAYKSTVIVENHKLQNNDIATITDSTLASCVTNCIKNQQCKSVNYNQNTCKLNDATRTEDESNFVENSGERYIEMSPVVTKAEGICAFVDCGSGNVCIDVPGAMRRYLCICSETGYLAEQCPSPACLEPLGMESGDIFDGQLSASSTFSDSEDYGPKCARLNAVPTSYCVPCWIPHDSDINSWIQIHLMVEHNITGIQTQGRTDLSQWVKTYTISYIKVNQVGDNFISNGHGNQKIFDGNWDQTSVRTHYFNPVIQGVAIRIYPKSYHNYRSLRAEVLGCRIGNEWVRVFKGVSMTGVSINSAWQTGSETSSHHAHQFLISDTFYKSNAIFDNWSTLNIQQVKLTAFSAFHEELFSITFDGVGSTTNSWFSKDRVQSSPWDDMQTASSNIFSVDNPHGEVFI